MINFMENYVEPYSRTFDKDLPSEFKSILNPTDTANEVSVTFFNYNIFKFIETKNGFYWIIISQKSSESPLSICQQPRLSSGWKSEPQ